MANKVEFTKEEAMREYYRLKMEIRSYQNDKCFVSLKFLRQRMERLRKIAGIEVSHG